MMKLKESQDLFDELSKLRDEAELVCQDMIDSLEQVISAHDQMRQKLTTALESFEKEMIFSQGKEKMN
jgi:hypothetical protein